MSQLVFPLIGYAITHSTVQAGLATTGLALGEVTLRLPAGALVDRTSRSRVLITSNVISAGIFASLAVAVFTAHLTLTHLIIAGFLAGAAEAFMAPATSAAIRVVVPAAQLPLAYTRLEARSSAVHLIGPPLGGSLYSLARGIPFIVDAASYAIDAVAVTRLRTPLPAPERERHSVLADVIDGLRFVWDHVAVRCLMIWGGLLNFAVGFTFVAIILRLVKSGAHPAAIGLVGTAGALAGLVGALIAPRIINRAATGWLTVTLTLACAVPFLPLAWTTNILATALLLAGADFLIPAVTAGISAYIASVVPDAMQGRINSAAGFIASSIAPLGPALAGIALATVGGRATLILGAAMTAATAIPLLASRSVRTLGKPSTWATRGAASEHPTPA